VDFNLPKEAWVSEVIFSERRNLLFIAADVHLIVFDLVHEKIAETLSDIAARKITCLVYNNVYDYLMIGCMDGMSIF
jgi:hypothetical protein